LAQSLPSSSKEEKPQENKPQKNNISTILEESQNLNLDKDPREYTNEEIAEIMIIAKGGDPKAQSLLQEIFKIETIQEKSNFPTAINQQKQTYLLMCSEFFGSLFGRPFRAMAKADAQSWRGYKGFNYLGNVDAVKQGTDLSGLIMPTPAQTVQNTHERKRRFWQQKQQGEQLRD
jgi:hypothetical protein